VLSPIPARHPQRATKIVSAVAVAQQNTGVVICCAIVPLGRYLVAGDYILLGAIVTIVVVLACLLEVGKRAGARAPAKATAPAVQPRTPAPAAGSASSI
jgi:hypothetical protein